jgi:hypothetical protein
MTIKQEFQWTGPEGADVVSLQDWATTSLSEEELAQLNNAQQRQMDLVVAAGGTFSGNSIEYADTDALALGRQQSDSEFNVFLSRYLSETGVTIDVVIVDSE